MKCITGQCNKTVQSFVVTKETAINPQTCDIGELRKLFGYFQYKAPNTSSFQSDKLDEEYHEELYEEMTKSWKKECRKIIASNATYDELSPKYALSGDSLCSYCKRFLCKRLRTQEGHKETDLDCLLRHIRNSLAHGRVFVIHGGNSIKVLLEDYDKRYGTITGRIICNQSDLKNGGHL